MKLFSFKSRTPRWIVVVADLMICGLSLSLAYLIRFDLKAEDELIAREWDQLSGSILYFFIVKAIVFYLFQIHQGLLRHTSTAELKRIIMAVTTSSLIFLILGFIRKEFIDSFYLFPLSVLIIEYIACLMFLVGSRFFIKLVYLENLKVKNQKENVLIFGAGVSGVITKRTIDKDSKTKFKVLGFIDDNRKLVGNRIEGLKVYSFEKIKKQIKKLEVKAIILSIQNLDKKRQSEIATFCISNNVMIQKVPNAANWVNGSLSIGQFSNIKIDDLLGRQSILLEFDKISADLTNRTVLVTGAAGSIGSGLCTQISSFKPKKIILLDQSESALNDLHIDLQNQFSGLNAEVVICDICNNARMRKMFELYKIEVIFHAAAYKHVPMMEINPAEAIQNNVLGTKIVADLANEFGISKMVMISTDKAVNPTNVMGASKRIAEMYIQNIDRESDTKFITTRFGNVLGSNGSVIPLFRKQIQNGGPVTVTDKKITRFFMTIPEACQLVLEAGTMGNGGEIYVFEMGNPVKISELAEKMIALANLKVGEDIEIKYVGLRPGEKLYEELLTNEENTLPTHHKKILIAKTVKVQKKVMDEIRGLIELVPSQDKNLIVQKMKKIVPEYVSNNSEFQKFD